MEDLRTLHPAYFALVMATGIVSIAAKVFDLAIVADVLFVVNVVAFLALWLLTIVRLVRFPRSVFADLTDHQRGVGFFTTVAGTSVFGSQLVLLRQRYDVALVLWWITVVLWLLLMYGVFTALTVKENKPTLEAGIHGGWLVAVVATQSVSTLASLLAPSLGAAAESLSFVSLSFWLAGGMLYIWLISLIFYRYAFFRLSPGDLMPPYWINMGAMAISTLAGALLVGNAGSSSLLGRLAPFLLGLTMLFWATATWWIPMLVILGFWRHVYRRFPLEYHPLYWGAVFPLGMYAVATARLSRVTGVLPLIVIGKVFVWIALAAWGMTFLGLLRRLVFVLRSRTQPAGSPPIETTS
jgi:tellurite resistance protein TehA-like permease